MILVLVNYNNSISYLNLNLTFMISGKEEDYQRITNAFHSVSYTQLSYDFRRLEIWHTNNAVHFSDCFFGPFKSSYDIWSLWTVILNKTKTAQDVWSDLRVTKWRQNYLMGVFFHSDKQKNEKQTPSQIIEPFLDQQMDWIWFKVTFRCENGANSDRTTCLFLDSGQMFWMNSVSSTDIWAAFTRRCNL